MRTAKSTSGKKRAAKLAASRPYPSLARAMTTPRLHGAVESTVSADERERLLERLSGKRFDELWNRLMQHARAEAGTIRERIIGAAVGAHHPSQLLSMTKGDAERSRDELAREMRAVADKLRSFRLEERLAIPSLADELYRAAERIEKVWIPPLPRRMRTLSGQGARDIIFLSHMANYFYWHYDARPALLSDFCNIALALKGNARITRLQARDALERVAKSVRARL